MKKTNHCLKCDSARVITFKSSLQYSSVAAVNWMGMVTARLERHICVDCGYTEEYVMRDKKFLKWAEKELKKQGPKGDGFV